MKLKAIDSIGKDIDKRSRTKQHGGFGIVVIEITDTHLKKPEVSGTTRSSPVCH